jgi:protein-tyrosine phosphatase
MKATIYWIDGPWPGRLSVLARPRGGEWLEEEVRSWRAQGIFVAVSLISTDEVSELNLSEEKDACSENGIDVITFPIADRDVPDSKQATLDLVRRLETRLVDGKSVGIHCRQAIGRSAIIAVCLLALGGVEIKDGFERVRTARGCSVPDTAEQREWVEQFAQDLLAAH